MVAIDPNPLQTERTWSPITFPHGARTHTQPGTTASGNPKASVPGTTQTNTPTAGLDPSQRNAYTAVIDMLKEFGLESLAPKILGYVQQGYDSSTIGYELQQTSEWKTRFAANETRKKNGLPVLSPQEYIATERSYRQIMQNAGVPAGFYDQTSDFQKFLENDVSPDEVNNRVKAATDFINRKDPQELAIFKKFYTNGDMIAYALDPTRAQPLVGKAFEAATIAGQAQTQGISIDKGLAEGLAGDGITRDQAQQGFGLIAQEQGNANKLSSIYGQDGFTTSDLVNETFRADASVANRRKKLASQERGNFSGTSGIGATSLSQGSGAL